MKLSETFEQEDNFELTAEERVDAERIRQNEQLRLGNPAGYRAMMADHGAAKLKGVNAAMGRTIHPLNQAMPNLTPAPVPTQQLPTCLSNGLESHPQPQALSVDLSGRLPSNGHINVGPPFGRHIMTPVLASNTKIRVSTASLSPEKEPLSTPAATNQTSHLDKEQSIGHAIVVVQDRTEPLTRSIPPSGFDTSASQQRHKRVRLAAIQQVATTDTDPAESSPSRRASSTGCDFIASLSGSASETTLINEHSRNKPNLVQSKKTASGNIEFQKTGGRQGDPPTDKKGLIKNDIIKDDIRRSRKVILEEKSQSLVNAAPLTTDSNLIGANVSTKQALTGAKKLSHAAAEKASRDDSNRTARNPLRQAAEAAHRAKGEGEELRPEDKVGTPSIYSAPRHQGWPMSALSPFLSSGGLWRREIARKA